MTFDQKRNQALGASVRISLEAVGIETIKNGPFFGLGETASNPLKLAA